ncbi:MAG: Fe-S cluster assembly protein SufD [Pseudomonadota bacterium]|nr:Fe-S cluster assembly protein SufD [Pseudomonadota bacterium]
MEAVAAAHKIFMNSHRADRAEVNEIRLRGLAEFMALGPPSSKDEDWKYTNLKKLSELVLRYSYATKAVENNYLVIEELLEKNRVGKNRVVFLNGKVLPELSMLTVKDEYVVNGAITTPVAPAKNLLANLNNAFLISPLEISIKNDAKVVAPIWIVNVSSNSVVSNTSVGINFGVNSSAELVEAFFSLDDKPCFVNALTKINVNAGASADHFIFQDLGKQDGIAHSLLLILEQDATFGSLNLAKSYGWSRNSIWAELKKPGAHVSLFGLNLLSDEQFIDHCLKVIHAAAQTKSRQLYKGVLSGKSKSIFNGKITIDKGAMGALAEQLNKNIICDRNSEAITRPQLEINADDVKATHGATIGKINPEELFYLESRGLSAEQARRLLTEGFVREVLDLGLKPQLRIWALDQLNIGELVGKNVV